MKVKEVQVVLVQQVINKNKYEIYKNIVFILDIIIVVVGIIYLLKMNITIDNYNNLADFRLTIENAGMAFLITLYSFVIYAGHVILNTIDKIINKNK